MRVSALALVILVPALSAASAQQAAQPPAGANWQRVQALPAGAFIQVKTRTRSLSCTLKAVDADSLTCTHGKETMFQRAEIQGIHIPHRGRSAIAGLAIGAGGGAIAGAAIVGPCTSFCIVNRGTGALVAGAGVGIIGSLIGLATDFTRSTVYKTP
jgi:ABC-type uncharacterized transport system permease subunit